MIHITICCGGGFSSSFMARKVEKEIKEMGLDKDYQVDFQPFVLFKENHENVDVVMCCPHLEHAVYEWCEKETVDFPVYLLPMLIYGRMTAQIIIEDAQDIIEQFKKTKTNPCYFDGEPRCTHNKRATSYRRVKHN